MTGYGKSNISVDTRQYQVEIKSVNHRYLDITIKMPRTISYLEEDVKKEIQKQITRGKVEVFITYTNNGKDSKDVKINKELAKRYISELRKLANEENLQANIEVTEISKFPDVLIFQCGKEQE